MAKQVRVLRVMEYIYPSAERMMDDMARWKVQETFKPYDGCTIRSTTLTGELLDAMLSVDRTD